MILLIQSFVRPGQYKVLRLSESDEVQPTNFVVKKPSLHNTYSVNSREKCINNGFNSRKVKELWKVGIVKINSVNKIELN